MKKTIHHLIAIAFVITLAAGCASAPARFYSLNSTAVGDGAANTNYSVIVGPVSVPALVDRPQWVVDVATNRVAIDEFNRWAEPLNDNIASVVADDLAVLLGTSRVAVAPMANFDAAWRVAVSIQRFESRPGRSVLIEAVWTVRKSTGGNAQCGRTLASEPLTGTGFSELAAAHSRALAKISHDIANVIHAGAE